MEEDEVQRLEAFCQGLGATEAQARTMASQLLKRADQVSAQRGISRVEAMEGLLQMLLKAQVGEVYDPTAGEGGRDFEAER